MMIPRIAGDISLLVLIFIIPWWIVAIPAIIGTFVYRGYFEIVILALLADGLRGQSFLLDFPITISALLVIILATHLKTKILYYEN